MKERAAAEVRQAKAVEVQLVGLHLEVVFRDSRKVEGGLRAVVVALLAPLRALQVYIFVYSLLSPSQRRATLRRLSDRIALRDDSRLRQVSSGDGADGLTWCTRPSTIGQKLAYLHLASCPHVKLSAEDKGLPM